MKVGKLEEIIEELKMNQSELLSHLENCKITEYDLAAYRIESVSSRKLIRELKANQTKLASELEDYKRTDKLLITQRELNDCKVQLNYVTREEVQKHAHLLITQRKLNDCNVQLNNFTREEVQKHTGEPKIETIVSHFVSVPDPRQMRDSSYTVKP